MSTTIYNLVKGHQEQIFLFKGHTPVVVTGNEKDIKQEPYGGMKEVLIQDLLAKEIAYDMNIRILSFKPGAHMVILKHTFKNMVLRFKRARMYNVDNAYVPQSNYL